MYGYMSSQPARRWTTMPWSLPQVGHLQRCALLTGAPCVGTHCKNDMEGSSVLQGEKAKKIGKASRMEDCSGRTAKRPRADAVRNRERVLEAAKAVFNAGGPDAS